MQLAIKRLPRILANKNLSGTLLTLTCSLSSYWLQRFMASLVTGICLGVYLPDVISVFLVLELVAARVGLFTSVHSA